MIWRALIVLEKIKDQIQPLDEVAMEKCQIRIDNLTKPLNSLYYFEVIAKKLAGITGNPRPEQMLRKVLIVNTLDNNILGQDPVLEVFARRVNAKLVIVPKSEVEKISKIVTVNELDELFAKHIGQKQQIIALGQYGINASNSSKQLFGYFKNEELGSLNLLKIDQGILFLAKLILAATKNKCLIVLDGLATILAAMLAVKIAPQVKQYLVAAHYARDKEQLLALQLLDLPAYLYLDLAGDDGLGATLGISLVDAALHVLNDMKTFGEAEVAVANDGPGAEKQNKNIK